MFTPQRQQASVTPSLRIGGISNARTDRKGKAVSFSGDVTASRPTTGPLRDNEVYRTPADSGNIDDWRRFKEAGLLDEATMERKDREALLEKISKLEKELYDYQYNMGLLLIEKKETTSKNEKLIRALEESEEILKREQRSNLMALSEAENREANLRVALAMEKQSVKELEKALNSIEKENAEIKLSSEAKLAEANAWVASIESKALEVEKKSHDAEAKLAEVARKSSELERKLKDVETRESLHQREHHSLVTERKAHEATFYKQREDLHEWEKNLQEKEERLNELRRSLAQKEEKANENERILEQKERSLEKAQNKIDLSMLKLKESEEQINIRLEALAVKEKGADMLKCTLEKKHKDLHELEEKLITKEQVGLKKILDDQRSVLDSKTRELQCELEEKRKSFDEELRKKMDKVEQHKADISLKEEKLRKREATFDKRDEKLKEKEQETEAKLKKLMEKEKSIRTEEKRLEMAKQQLLTDREGLHDLKNEIEQIGAEITRQQSRIREEQERLKITEEERSEHIRLQSELKQQLEKCRREEELLQKAHEDLKKEKERFEKEWVALDEKRIEISKTQNEITEEREKLKGLQLFEEKRLKKEESFRNYTRRELEDIRIRKEALETNLIQEQLSLSARPESEHCNMVHEVETQKKIFETELRKRQDENEANFQKRVEEFEESSKRKHGEINQLKQEVETEMEKVESEKHALEKERNGLALQKEKLKREQIEIHNDIEELGALSGNLKKSREQFICERARFLGFVEEMESCHNCGEIIKAFVHSDLQLPDAEQVEPLPLLCDKIANKVQAELNSCDVGTIKSSTGGTELGFAKSGGRLSWFQKVTSIFNVSPSKRNQLEIDQQLTKDIPSSAQVNLEIKVDPPNDCAPSTTDNSYIDSRTEENPEYTEQSELKSGKQRRGRPKKNKRKPRSVKAHNNDAKSLLGNSLEDSMPTATVSNSGRSERKSSKVTRKRLHVETSNINENGQDGDESDRHTESATVGQRKRRQIPQVLHTAGEHRYHLRRHKSAGTNSAQALSGQLTNNVEKEAGNSGSGDADGAPNREASSEPMCGSECFGQPTDFVKVTKFEGVEIPEERVVRADISTDGGNDGGGKEIENLGELDHTGDRGEDDMNANKSGEENEYEGDDDNDYSDDGDGDGGGDDDDRGEEKEHPGEPSIGKQIWTFFTT